MSVWRLEKHSTLHVNIFYPNTAQSVYQFYAMRLKMSAVDCLLTTCAFEIAIAPPRLFKLNQGVVVRLRRSLNTDFSEWLLSFR